MRIQKYIHSPKFIFYKSKLTFKQRYLSFLIFASCEIMRTFSFCIKWLITFAIFLLCSIDSSTEAATLFSSNIIFWIILLMISDCWMFSFPAYSYSFMVLMIFKDRLWYSSKLIFTFFFSYWAWISMLAWIS